MRSSAIGVIAVLVGLVGGASPAVAASNPGTGDPGFFTFRPEPHAGATVNVANGNLVVRARDLADSTHTNHVVVDRFYNSRADPRPSILGPRWGLDVAPSTTISDTGERAVVTGPSGYRVSLTRRLDGMYVAPIGFDGVLVRRSTDWTIERPSAGDAFFFSSAGRLEATRDAYGRSFTVANVTGGGRALLSSYGSASGRRARFCYRGDGLVRGFDDPAGGRHRYSYAAGRSSAAPRDQDARVIHEDESRHGDSTTAHGSQRCAHAPHPQDHRGWPDRHLKRVADAHGTVATYGYDDHGLLSSIRLRSGEQVYVVHTDDGRVRSFAVNGESDLQRTRFDYERRRYKTDVVGPTGVRRTYAYDDEWRVTRQYNPDVSPSVHAAGEL